MSDGARFVRPSLDQLPPGDPAPVVGPEMASMGLNEGLEGPFPSALEAISAAVPSLNRYPGRGSRELVEALSTRHEVPAASVFVAAGADAVIGYVCQAVLETGDEAVIPWPSFPSFLRDPQKRDAAVVTVPLADYRIDLDAMRNAITPHARLVFLATPNNPTGLALDRDELHAFIDDLPERVLPVIDEAYFDYLDPAARVDSIADVVRRGRDAVVLRTFSKLYGLAGLRVGYGVGPEAVIGAMRKVQRGYDVGALAQVAALASLDDTAEVERRRAATRDAVRLLAETLAARGLQPVPGSVTNFVLVEVGASVEDLVSSLLRNGVAVQSGAPFGAPSAIRISTGSHADVARLDAALADAGFPVG